MFFREPGASTPELDNVCVPMIQIRDLFFRYGESFQLRLAALDIAQGSKVAIVGRSGSGKTTLLNLIAGVHRPIAGEVHVCGTRLDRMNEAQLRRFRAQTMGFVYQELELIEYLTVRENVLLPIRLQPRLRSRLDLHAQLQALLDVTGLHERANHFPGQLSQGQRQRAALCRALITLPQILLADEPTGNLDEHTAKVVFDLLFEQTSRSSATLVMATHDVHWLERFDRVLRIEEITGQA